MTLAPVSARERVVTLEGLVPSEAERDSVDCPGVTDHDNLGQWRETLVRLLG